MDVKNPSQLTEVRKPLKLAEVLKLSKGQFIRTMQSDIESLQKGQSAKPLIPKADQVKKAAPPAQLPVIEPARRPVAPPFPSPRLESAEGLKKEAEIKKRIKETQKRLVEERMRAETARQKTKREKVEKGKKEAKKAEPVPSKKKPSFMSRLFNLFHLFRPSRPVKPSKPAVVKAPIPPKPIPPKPIPLEPVLPKLPTVPKPIPLEPIPLEPVLPKPIPPKPVLPKLPTVPKPIPPKPVSLKKELPLEKEVKPAIKGTRLKFVLIGIGTIVVIAGIGGFLYWWNYLRVIPPVAMYHQCQDFQCVDIEGEGVDECLVNEDCQPSYYQCQDSQCIETEGAGEDQCLTDEDCEPVEPTVPDSLIHVDETTTIELTIGQENLLLDELKSVAVQEQATTTLKRILVKLVSQTEKKYADLDTFVSALGISLPDNILSVIASSEVAAGNYTLFFYNQSEGNRLGIVIDMAESSTLVEDLKIWEETIITDLGSLLLKDEIPIPFTEEFQDNTYQDIAIRYLNFPQPDLSIDYAIVAGKLVITTSRESMYATIDALLAVGTEQEECATEGEMFPAPVGELGMECCPGLKTGGSYILIEEECNLEAGVAICINCPNGECGLGENKCNCPEDCQ